MKDMPLLENPFAALLSISPSVHAGVLRIKTNIYEAIYGLLFLIKGESSHWINESNLFRGKFYWQKRYGAFSVSACQVKRVESYIQKQELYHKKETFREELENFYLGYGLDPKENDWKYDGRPSMACFAMGGALFTPA